MNKVYNHWAKLIFSVIVSHQISDIKLIGNISYIYTD